MSKLPSDESARTLAWAAITQVQYDEKRKNITMSDFRLGIDTFNSLTGRGVEE